MIDLLSIDVEDPSRSARLDGSGPAPDPARMERDVAGVLGLLERHGARATFFVVGDVAAAAPQVVREIVRRGHEIGSHGMRHLPVSSLDRAGFRDDLAKSLDALASAGAPRILGFRAPWWSIPRETHWSLEEIERAGLRYDSSVFPVRTTHYGNGRAPMTPHAVRGSALWEIPPACASLGFLRVPGPGGFFCRVYPSALAKLLTRVGSAPRHLYFHSWELVPAAAPEGLGLVERAIHLLGRSRMTRRVDALLAGSRTRALEEVLPA